MAHDNSLDGALREAFGEPEAESVLSRLGRLSGVRSRILLHEPAGDESPLLRVPDLATLLGLSENAVRDMLARGEVPGSKLGRQWVVRGEALVEHLKAEERRRLPAQAAEAALAAHRRPGSRRADLERQARAAR